MEPNVDPSLDAMDRRVRVAALAADAWHDRLAGPPLTDALEDQPPLERHRAAAGKRAFDDLAALDVLASDTEWRDALRRWVGFLTVLRVTEDSRADEARAENEMAARIRLERTTVVSFRQAWLGLLGAKSDVEGDAWLAAVVERAGAVATMRYERAAREEEAAVRLGASSLGALVDAEPRVEVEAAARTFLTRTGDLARALRRDAARAGDGHVGSFVATVRASLAREAADGWPTRITLRSLVETLGAPSDIGRGLRVTSRLPTPLGAASFARGLGAFGEAYRRAVARSSGAPFAVAVDPHFVDAYRFRYVFAALPTTSAYGRRGLGLVARVASDQARALANASLLHARHVAMAALLTRGSGRVDLGLFEELTADVYGEALPVALAGAFPRRTGEETALMAALLSSLPLLERLRDGFDEDWFRNPLAWRFLRARASGPARVPGAQEGASPDALASAFERALG